MGNEERAAKRLDSAVTDFHRAVCRPDDPKIVTGWVLVYTAADGSGNEMSNYAAGEGTALPTAVGLLDMFKDQFKRVGRGEK